VQRAVTFFRRSRIRTTRRAHLLSKSRHRAGDAAMTKLFAILAAAALYAPFAFASLHQAALIVA